MPEAITPVQFDQFIPYLAGFVVLLVPLLYSVIRNTAEIRIQNEKYHSKLLEATLELTQKMQEQDASYHKQVMESEAFYRSALHEERKLNASNSERITNLERKINELQETRMQLLSMINDLEDERDVALEELTKARKNNTDLMTKNESYIDKITQLQREKTKGVTE